MVRLIDVAMKSGYSKNTVSRVVNGDKAVAPETRKKIEKVIKEMGYIGNNAAKQLRTGKTNTIAFVADDFINPKNAAILDEVILYAGHLNYNVCAYNTYGNENKEREIIKTLINENVAGVLISPIQKTTENRTLLLNSKLPVVLIERVYDEFDKNLSSVIYDEFRMGIILGELMLKNNCRKIVVINSEAFAFNGRKRIEGIRHGLSLYGETPNIKEVINLPLNIKTWEKVFSEFSDSVKTADAIICYDDIVAINIRNLLSRDEKLPVITGCGNILKNYLINDIYTITSFKERLSVAAVDMLMRLIKGGEIEHKTLAVKLV